MRQKHTLQWLSAVTGRAKGLVGLLVVVQTVLSVSSIAFAFVLRRIINMAVDGAWGSFWAALAALVGILLGQIILSAAGRFLSEYTSSAVENRFKHRLFSALLTGDYASVAAVHSGEWVNRLTSDTTVVAGGVTQIVPGLIGMLVRLLGAVAAILWLEPRFLYILLPGGAAMMLLTYAFRKILKRLHKKIQETDGALRVFLQERLESLVIVRTFAKEEQMVQQADDLMDAHKAARMKRSNFSNLCNIGFAGAHGWGVSAGHRVLRLWHPDRHHELRQPDGHYAAGGAGAKPVCQPDRLSSPVLFHAGQRRASDGSGSICAGQHRNCT